MSTLARFYAEVRSAGARADLLFACAWAIVAAAHIATGEHFAAAPPALLTLCYLRIVAMQVAADLEQQAHKRLLKAILHAT